MPAVHIERDGVSYYNSGSWIDEHPTYITIDEEGVRIQEYVEAPDLRDLDESIDHDLVSPELLEDTPLLEEQEYEGVGR
jgi:hypothetical protein